MAKNHTHVKCVVKTLQHHLNRNYISVAFTLARNHIIAIFVTKVSQVQVAEAHIYVLTPARNFTAARFVMRDSQLQEKGKNTFPGFTLARKDIDATFAIKDSQLQHIGKFMYVLTPEKNLTSAIFVVKDSRIQVTRRIIFVVFTPMKSHTNVEVAVKDS